MQPGLKSNNTPGNKLQNFDFNTFFIATPTVAVLPLFPFPVITPFRYQVLFLQGINGSAGTGTVSFKIDGVNIPGLSSIAVTSTKQNIYATGTILFYPGQTLQLDISSISSLVNLSGCLLLKRV